MGGRWDECVNMRCGTGGTVVCWLFLHDYVDIYLVNLGGTVGGTPPENFVFGVKHSKNCFAVLVRGEGGVNATRAIARRSPGKLRFRG